ncbi:hypothetical protein CVT25_001604 [Psilocybe cyanescens]|uniref:J domain-containing protein n=1 Tax=Psilocybe cyanescens TaxID=93625 RepID=A0A409WQ11_PSICY|nr:hypothetical protein CVT25_001604 [Psilocybe cyanescens]
MSSTADEDVNPYDLLGVKTEATEQEIRTAYRQRSLKVHPDRNPNNPDAARKFHELNQAYELLLDPLRRLALDAKLRIKLARKERFKAYDNKRKNLVEELEERERAFKKTRMDKQKEEVQTWHETEKIKEEGKRLREQKEQEMKNRMYPPRSDDYIQPEEMEEEEAPPAMDTTVRLKYRLKSHPTLTTPSAIASFLSRFGATDESSIVLSKPPKTGSALVPFKQIGDAFAAVCASERKESGMDGVKITWVNSKEPDILGWLRKMGKLGSVGTGTSNESTSNSNVATPSRDDGLKADLPQHQSHKPNASPFSSFPSTFPETFPTAEPAPVAPAPGIDYESLTLMRMRQAERERLEREILEQEANE